MWTMLALLEQRKLGTLSPVSFTFAESTRRTFSLEMSASDVESVHSAGVNTLDIENVEQRYLLSGSSRGALAIHDLYNLTGQLNFTSKAVCTVDRNSRHAHSFSVETVQWYPFDTGMFISSGMDGRLKVWDTVTMKPADTYNLKKRVYSHHMSSVASHTYIAVGLDHPHVVLIDMKTGSQCHELHGHKGKVMCARWSPSAEYILATSGTDNKILLWDVRSAKCFLSALDQHNGEALSSRKDLVTAHNGFVNSLCFSPDGLYLVSFGSDNQLRLWDVAMAKNTLVNFGNIHNDYPKSLQMDLCYNTAVPVVFVPSQSKISIYDMFTGSRITVLLGHFGLATCCMLRSSFHELFSGGYDHKIIRWTPDIQQEQLASGEEEEESDNAAQDNWSD